MSKRLIAAVMLQRAIRSRVAGIVNEVYKTVQKPALFGGHAREYTPKDEEGFRYPAENLAVQFIARDLLVSLATDIGSMWDATATRDTGNQLASANVIVRGNVILENVSLSTLLFLEKQLIDIRTIISACPTLDNAKTWETDDVTGVSRSAVVESTRSEKIEETVIVVPATEKHAAQTRDRVRDRVVGTWLTTHLSGALTLRDQHAMISRVNELIDATKVAREEANVILIEDVRVGDALFGFILGANRV